MPERYQAVPELSGREAEPAYNVAHAYAQLLRDWTDGTEVVPTFADAVHRHRLLDRIARAAAPGERACRGCLLRPLPRADPGPPQIRSLASGRGRMWAPQPTRTHGRSA